jgi:Tfp pilus assembly protein PilF
MIRFFFILFCISSLTSCYIVKQKKEHYKNHKIEIANPLISKYLIANYSISKGDYHTASEVLNSDFENHKLIKLKFYSNLVVGNFIEANRVSNLIVTQKKENFLYSLPQYILNIKNRNFKEILENSEANMMFANLKSLNSLINLWFQNKENITDNNIHSNFQNTSLHELLILENSQNNKSLKEIADFIYKNEGLNHNDYLFLAGFYFRLNDFKKFNEIIETKLTNQFDKKLIIKNFYLRNDIFSKKPQLNVILSSKLYNDAIANDTNGEKSQDLRKILLEMSVFICPEMDISKYTLAEIYSLENSNNVALKKLDTIKDDSFFFLASILKKLSINKSIKMEKDYKKLLFENMNIYPDNEYLLYEVANYYKLNKQYNKSLRTYEKIINNFGENNRLNFLYASNLDKVGEWNKAKNLFFKILNDNPNDTYTLNYISYTLSLRDKDLDNANNLINKALSMDPENGYFLDTKGWVEYKRKNFKDAVFYLEKAVSILPRSAEVLDHLGDCYLKLNRKKEAVYEWKRALKYEKDEILLNKISQKIRENE